jgi:hypothetical protein
VKTTTEPAEGTPLVYQCALPLSRQTLTFVAGLLRAHLKKIGSRWRKLPPGKIALITLAALRHDHRLADMAAATASPPPPSTAGPGRSSGCSPPAPPASTAPSPQSAGKAERSCCWTAP